MKKRTLNELRQEKEYGYKPPVDKKNPEKELMIKITITDGEKKIKSQINVSHYEAVKKLHDVSLVDETVIALLEQFKNNN
jgi:hypothetical protein